LAWLLKDPVYLVYDFLRPPIFDITTALPPNLPLIWSRLWVLVVLAAVLACGLLLWAVKERHRLKATNGLTPPPVLDVTEHADWFRVDANTLVAARNFQVTDVQFHEDGTIAAFDGRGTPGAITVNHCADNKTVDARVVSVSSPIEPLAGPAPSGPAIEP